MVGPGAQNQSQAVASGVRPDIFLSYSRLDRKIALEIAAGLEAEGFNVWWDKAIQSGTDWRQTIEGKVHRARCVVLVWSKRAEQSWWVAYEAFQAQQQEKLILTSFEDIGGASQSWAKHLQCRRLRRPIFKHFTKTEAWSDLTKEINQKRRRLPRFEFRGWLGGGVAHAGGVTCVEFHPFDDTCLLTSGRDGRAILWSTDAIAPDLKTRAQEEGDDLLDAASVPGGKFTFQEKGGRVLHKCGFNATGDLLFAAGERGNAYVFRGKGFDMPVAEMPHLRAVDPRYDGEAPLHASNQFSNGVVDAAFGPDETLLTIGGGRAHLWRLADPAAPSKVIMLPEMARGRSVDCAYSPAAKSYFVTDRRGGVHAITPDGSLAAHMMPPRRPPGAIMAHGRPYAPGSVGGETMAVASTNAADARVEVFGWSDGAYGKLHDQELRADYPLRGLALHPEAPVVALATGYRPYLISYDDAEKIGLQRGGYHSGQVAHVAFSPSGRYMASAGDDGCVGIWEDTLPR